nr:retrovirus-related Pol polyprotein from transposon TNT 1-94 [Tanacetum cinerariifolium]
MGKDNGENIVKSINEGPFNMGKFRETLAEGAEGTLHLGPEQDRVVADLIPEEKERYKADIRETNIPLKGNENLGQGKLIKCYNCNGIRHITRKCTHLKLPQNSKYFKDKMLLMQAQENRVVLDEEQILFIAGRQADTFDDDVDEPSVQDLALLTMFIANLSSADPVYDEAGPSYDPDILSK